MSDVPIVVEIDCSTGETTERPMTESEIAEASAAAQEHAAALAIAQEEASARAALRQSAITKLTTGQPLTPEEAELIVLA